MMIPTLWIKDLFEQREKLIDCELFVNGWVKTVRRQPHISFITINDGSCFQSLQIVVETANNEFEEILQSITTGSSLKIGGLVVKSIGAGQDIELKAGNIHVYGHVYKPESYPISAKPHSIEHLREHSHLKARSNLGGSIARVRNSISRAIHNYFQSNGFYWVATPIITSSDCEGAGEMFRVTTLDLGDIAKNGKVDFAEDFFGKDAFLTVSGQLNGETHACALGRIYTFGPTFRAENSNTTRHLAEFWMVEPEMAFCDLAGNIKVAESMLASIASNVLEDCHADVVFLNKHIDKTILDKLHMMQGAKFTHLEYSDAIRILEENSARLSTKISWGEDLSTEHERFLSEEYVKGMVVVKNYPKEIKAFYMRVNEDNRTVAAMDILAPGIGEIIGGSQREERYEHLVRRMHEFGLSQSEYKWYLDLRQYGSVPHSGYGLGLERLVSYMTGMSNIRDTIPFYRAPKHISY